MNSILHGFYHTFPLWTKQQFGLTQFDFPEITLDGILAIDFPENLRLGHQMEYVFKHLMGMAQDYELVLSNVLVDEGKTRIGELDFILKNTSTQKYVHVELAYKFYIINPEISEPIYRLMGPNKRDMFHTKLDKLKTKQLPLLFHNSLAPYWETLEIDPIEIEQQCCFKVQLFEPYAENVSIRPLNTSCIVGKWLRFDDFNTPEFRHYHYYIPRKLEWVIVPHENVGWKSHYETLLDVNLNMVKENAPMLWIRKSTGAIEKVFVVWW